MIKKSDQTLSIFDPKRVCIFCDRKADSKEHLYPSWMYKLLPNERGILHRTNTSDGRTQEGILHRPTAKSATLRIICQYCNNGWMSEIQNEAKPILAEFIQGRVPNFGHLDQGILRKWAVMTTMCHEFADWTSMAIPKYWRAEFRDNQNKTDNFLITFALCDNFTRFGFNHFGWSRDRNNIVTIDGFPLEPPQSHQLTQLSLGGIAIFVYSSTCSSLNDFSYYEYIRQKFEIMNVSISFKKQFFLISSLENLDYFTRDFLPSDIAASAHKLGDHSSTLRSGRMRPVDVQVFPRY